jgi:hypothetical protein
MKKMMQSQNQKIRDLRLVYCINWCGIM